MNMGLIIESVSTNVLVNKHSIAVKEMFNNAMQDDAKVFIESLDNYIIREFHAIDEADESTVGDKLKAKLKVLGGYLKSIYEYCMSVYNKFVSDIAVLTGKYTKYIKENETSISSGYTKLVKNDAEFKSNKFSKISKDNALKIIETKFGDIGIRLDFNSAYIEPKEITSEQKTKLTEEINAFTSKGVIIKETTKVSEVKLDDMLGIIKNALEDRLILYGFANYAKSMHTKVEQTGSDIGNKNGADALAIYMDNIKFASGIVSKIMTQYLNLHVKKTTTAFKFVKHCAAAGKA